MSHKWDKAGGWNSFWLLHRLVVSRWDFPASLGPPAHTTWQALDNRSQDGAGVWASLAPMAHRHTRIPSRHS